MPYKPRSQQRYIGRLGQGVIDKGKMNAMQKNNVSTQAALHVAVLALSVLTVGAAHAQMNSIGAGIQSTINNGGADTPGSINSAYVTAVFGGNAYLQDATGGIYFYKGGTGTGDFGLTASSIGSQVTGLTGGGFDYFGTQFEYEPDGGTEASTSTTAGTPQSIPASFYSSFTLTQFNSAAAQGSASAAGMQNQLLTIKNVTISGAGGTFATGAYTLTDGSGNTGTLYVNAASGLIGAPIPTGAANFSGVFQDFKGTSELLPRGTYDVTTAVPEPSSYVLMGLGGLTLVVASRRTKLA